MIRLIVLLMLSTGLLLPDKSVKILFVGNSLTYSNNLPKLLEDQATKAGIKIKTRMLAKPDYALEDHWNEGELQQLIKSGHYDFVVVQQGPSSQAEGREMLFNYGERISALCKQYDSKLAFFMVWPARANYKTFDGVIKNHTDAAAKSNALLCPVGKVWKEHFDSTANFDYYSPDQFHPSLMGSQVAAKVILESLTPYFK